MGHAPSLLREKQERPSPVASGSGIEGSKPGLSRIYGGVHTRIDHDAGLRLGQEVAGFVLAEAGSPGFGLRGS
jgi:hypothetical protein